MLSIASDAELWDHLRHGDEAAAKEMRARRLAKIDISLSSLSQQILHCCDSPPLDWKQSVEFHGLLMAAFKAVEEAREKLGEAGRLL
jgi:hypothetical protein